MNYIGSKKSLLHFIEESIHTVVENRNYTFCDLFAGTGIVGSHFKKLGYRIIANDLQYYSFVLNKHWIENNEELSFLGLEKIVPGLATSENKAQKVVDYLQHIPNEKGFIFQHYCYGGTKDNTVQRLYFTDENGMKTDAIRNRIESWKSKLTANEFFFLTACLLEAVDKVANTASVYGAFLKKIKKSAQAPLQLNPLQIISSKRNNTVFCSDALELTKKISSEIVYMDPPYNQRQYATNYHLLETIAAYDNPKIYGKTGLREYQHQKSDFCSKPKIKKAITDLIANVQAKYIFLSYNNEGLISPEDFQAIFQKYGEYRVFTKAYGRFKADTDAARNHKANQTTEYLHCLIKR